MCAYTFVLHWRTSQHSQEEGKLALQTAGKWKKKAVDRSLYYRLQSGEETQCIHRHPKIYEKVDPAHSLSVASTRLHTMWTSDQCLSPVGQQYTILSQKLPEFCPEEQHKTGPPKKSSSFLRCRLSFDCVAKKIHFSPAPEGQRSLEESIVKIKSQRREEVCKRDKITLCQARTASLKQAAQYFYTTFLPATTGSRVHFPERTLLHLAANPPLSPGTFRPHAPSDETPVKWFPFAHDS